VRRTCLCSKCEFLQWSSEAFDQRLLEGFVAFITSHVCYTMPVVEPALGNLEHSEHQGKVELGLVRLNELVSDLDSLAKKRPSPLAILPVRCMVRIKKVLPYGPRRYWLGVGLWR
jgi:hypothetical protein